MRSGPRRRVLSCRSFRAAEDIQPVKKERFPQNGADASDGIYIRAIPKIGFACSNPLQQVL
jgi:hypothetical protein